MESRSAIRTVGVAIARRACLVLAFGAAVSAAQEAHEEVEKRLSEETIKELNEVGKDVRKLGDWSEQAETYTAMLDRVWEDNHWGSESDVFAQSLARKITEIPPWEFNKRMEKITDEISERYRFDGQQKIRFRSRIYRETLGFFFSNAKVIAGHAGEFVRSRLREEPLTADQIARWTRESEPLVADSLSRMDGMVADLRSSMNAEQRKILERDYASFDRRMNDILKMRARWEQGRWDPRDWGFENDPIQNAAPHDRDAFGGGVDPFDPNMPEVFGHEVRRMTVAEDESSWARYVRRFVREHGLDPGQTTAIYSILTELESRAERYRSAHADELRSVPVAMRASSKAYKPIRTMFEELQARSEGLLTRPQRTADRSKS